MSDNSSMYAPETLGDASSDSVNSKEGNFNYDKANSPNGKPNYVGKIRLIGFIILIILVILIAYSYLSKVNFNVHKPTKIYFYGDGNVSLYRLVDYSVSKFNDDANLSYYGYISLKSKYENKAIPFNLIYERMNGSYRLLINSSNYSIINFSLSQYDLNKSILSCQSFYSSNSICHKGKTNYSYASDILSAIDPIPFINKTYFRYVKNSNFTADNCYLMNGSGEINNGMNYSYTTCISAEHNIPLYLSLNYRQLNGTAPLNETIYLEKVGYNNKSSKSFIYYLNYSKLKLKPPVLNEPYNCSNLTLSTGALNKSFIYRCSFKGGFMNLTYGSGGAVSSNLMVQSDNGATYYDGSVNNSCPKYIKSIFLPDEDYVINFTTNSSTGNTEPCANAIMKID